MPLLTKISLHKQTGILLHILLFHMLMHLPLTIPITSITFEMDGFQIIWLLQTPKNAKKAARHMYDLGLVIHPWKMKNSARQEWKIDAFIMTFKCTEVKKKIYLIWWNFFRVISHRFFILLLPTSWCKYLVPFYRRLFNTKKYFRAILYIFSY